MTLTLAIVGRPNVGKSTLFNRLIGKKLALVDDTPGVTRDRREGDAHISDLALRLIDTAGLEEAFDASLEARMRRQTEQAVADADVVLFMVDARAGVTPLDAHFAKWLRKSKRPVVLVANKCEGKNAEAGLMEAFALGLGTPVALSAEHGEGLADLYDAVQAASATRQKKEHVEEERREPAAPAVVDIGTLDEDEVDATAPVQLAIVGRPNAGKSTLVNQLLGQERLLTGPEAGLTRDSIAVDWTWNGQTIRLIDTAGLRRQGRRQEKLERLAAAESMRAIRLAQIVVLVIDGLQSLEKQDLAIAAHVLEEGRALILAVNKWDAVEDRALALRQIEDRLQTGMPQARGISIVTLSAKTGRHVDRLMPAVIDTYRRWNARVPTPKLNRWLADVTSEHPPPAVSGRRLRLRYAAQIKTRPPTFAIFCSRPDILPDAYMRYLINSLREHFDMPGVPIRLQLRKTDNPYDDKE